MAGVRFVDRVQVCGIRNFLTGCPGLVDPSYVAKLGRAAHVNASLSLLFNGHEQAGVDDRKRPVDQRWVLGTHSETSGVVGHVGLVSRFCVSEPIGPCRSMNTFLEDSGSLPLPYLQQ